ncbi:hypothetical protein PSTG_12398 [Puccinia striiformis f. sp. tritici PST-78]|uniref:Uncharacterized protein n=1 Tax=Puccinia striiformis f. sp. tritici PST-78 TaxID=1165861 RepID=A0A0L0V4Z2_9BASI|nr:hypothetical protein PSTG_12398 [Puccinia striiformis f. sp. tritici PST-78]
MSDQSAPAKANSRPSNNKTLTGSKSRLDLSALDCAPPTGRSTHQLRPGPRTGITTLRNHFKFDERTVGRRPKELRREFSDILSYVEAPSPSSSPQSKKNQSPEHIDAGSQDQIKHSFGILTPSSDATPQQEGAPAIPEGGTLSDSLSIEALSGPGSPSAHQGIYLHPDVLKHLPNQRAVSSNIAWLYTAVQESFIKQLDSHQGAMYLGLDAWQLPNAYDVLDTVIYCLVKGDSGDYKLEAMPLDFVQSKEQHTGVYLADTV